jgi:hypothetical protein
MECAGLTSPDFSVPMGCPLWLHEFQIRRAALVSELWARVGCWVMPSLIWCDRIIVQPIPYGSWCAVRGPQRGTESVWLLNLGHALHRHHARGVLVFGRWPFRNVSVGVPVARCNCVSGVVEAVA